MTGAPRPADLSELARLVQVVAALRVRCPWDSSQTHRSLVPFLVEEAMEVVEAIEVGGRKDLLEELGDLLFQVVFHAEIAGESPGGFGLDDLAGAVADKLVARHPHVFAAGSEIASDRDPAEVLADLDRSWEQRKAVEKGRSSVLEGIPARLSALSAATRIIGRTRSRGVPLALPDAPVTAVDVGTEVLELVARAQASGIDAEQAVRDAVRELEDRVRRAETGG